MFFLIGRLEPVKEIENAFECDTFCRTEAIIRAVIVNHTSDISLAPIYDGMVTIARIIQYR